MKRAFLAAFLICGACYAGEAPTSPAAGNAEKKYQAAVQRANEQYSHLLVAADKTYLADLDAAINVAKRAGKQDEVDAIQAKREEIVAAELEHEHSAAGDHVAPDAATDKPINALKGVESYTTRAQKIIKEGYCIGPDPHRFKLTPAAAKSIAAKAAEIDSAIRKGRESGELTDEMARAMWAGKPTIGMTSDQLKIFGKYSVRSETAAAQLVSFVAWEPPIPMLPDAYITSYLITLADGKAAQITRQ